MSTQIRYKGKPVVTFDKGTVTLRTQDSGLEGDIEVVSEGDTSGGGSDFNIAFGDTAPADTSKLWIKTSEPEEVNVTFSPVIANEKIKFGIGTLPLPKEGIASAVIGTKVYLFGGGSRCLDTINVFDAETETLTTLSTRLPTAAENIASAVVGTKVYLFGGYSNQGGYLDTINVFIVQMPLAANNMLIEASATKNMFNLLPTLELGVNAVYLGNTEGYGEKVPAALYVDGAWREI